MQKVALGTSSKNEDSLHIKFTSKNKFLIAFTP